MPVVACPGCGKQYKLPANAAGQVAKCACGKRFKLGASSPTPPAAASPPSRTTKPAPVAATHSPKPAAKPAPKAAPKPSKPTSAVTPAALAGDDDFWNEGLKPTPKPTPVASPPLKSTSPPKKKSKPKAESSFRWGFDGGKFIGGLLTFLIAGGITVGLVMTTGYLYFWPAGIAIAGLLSALSGLMGD